MTKVVVSGNSKDVIVTVPQPVEPPSAPPVKIGLVEISQVVVRGSIWETGHGPPVDPGGQYGDMYLDMDTGDVYHWDGDSWVFEGTFAPSTDTPEEVLAKLVQVDGPGSGLDADLLDGHDSPYFATQADMDAVEAVNAAQGTQIAINTTQIANNVTAIGDLIGEVDTLQVEMDEVEAKNATQDTAIALRLTDAPSDGLVYGRKNAAWATVIGGAVIADTPPTGTLQSGQMWWESDTGNLYIYYTDADSSQWVMIASGTMPLVVGDLNMQGFSIVNCKDITLSGKVTATGNIITSGDVSARDIILSRNASVGGKVTVIGDVISDGTIEGVTMASTNGHFIGRGAATVVSAQGAGSLYFRPNGSSNSAGQSTISSAGDFASARDVWAANSITATGSMYSGQNFQSNSANVVLAGLGGAVFLRPHGANNPANETKLLGNGRLQVGIGYQCKAGETGGFGANSFNFYWTGTGINTYIDATFTGLMAMQCDYRVKKDVADLPGTWDKVKALRPISYTAAAFGIFEENDIPQWGMIAHEVQEALLPSAATGEKDGEDVQNLNLIPIVAALTKALQEAMARIEALEAR